MLGSGEVFNKSHKRDDSFFIKLPSDLANYVYIKGYSADMNYLYALIVDHYNVQKGYAYPSQLRLSRLYGKTEKTLRKHLEKLREVKLIDYDDISGSKAYVPLVPLTREELWEQVPEAKQRYLDAIKKESDERERNQENWLATKGYR